MVCVYCKYYSNLVIINKLWHLCVTSHRIITITVIIITTATAAAAGTAAMATATATATATNISSSQTCIEYVIYLAQRHV